MIPVVLLDAPGGNYWHSLQQFIREHLLASNMIAPEDLHLYRVTDCCQEALEEILGFYRVYQSMRYVKKKLVLRMLRPLSDDFLRNIQQDFADILTGGQFQQTAALPAERNETHLADLPRLTFSFNRRDHGRLRQLINAINQQ
jgi:hypothetical protein